MKLKIRKFGQFQLLKQIAKGGMAEIFLACSGNLKSAYRFVVIKRVLLAHSHNKEFNKMFQNEGKIAVNLTHSNICSIYEFGIQKDQYFICMEYIAGRNIRQLAKKIKSQKKNLSVAMCAHILKYACNGLDYAHNCTDGVTGQPLNIIHRDISPQNIMVSFNGDVKLIDFGIAKIDNSESTRAGVLKGKFEYMSPEQVAGKNLDRQTDIFSLGNVLWELLARKKLFTGSSEMQILKKIRDCRIPDLKKINPAISDRLVEIVNKALSVNKNLRYQTAADMGNDLSVFLNKSYPDFTQAHFSSFIKEIYVEEILEERQNLKMYLQELVAKKSDLKKELFSRGNIDTSKSSFLGYSDKMNEQEDEEKPAASEDTATEGGYTVTATGYTATEGNTVNNKEYAATHSSRESASQAPSQPSREVTKTKFEDSLGGTSVHSKKSLSIRSDGYRNVLEEDSVVSESPKYKPWNSRANIYRTRTTNNEFHNGRKKSIFKTISVGLFIIGITGFFYFFKTDDILSFIQKNTYFKKQEADLPVKADKQPSLVEPIVTPKVKKAVPVVQQDRIAPKRGISAAQEEKPIVRKSVFIITQPSSAQIYINGVKTDRLTPTSVIVPFNKQFTLTIRRKGYHDKTVVLSPHSIQHTVRFALKKDQAKRRGRRRNESIIIR